MKKILLLTCCWLVAFGLYAQQRTVTGKVTDSSDGSGLPGVSILVKGTTTGTTSDVNGNFSIEADPSAVLVFSFIGFESQEYAVGDRTTFDVTMKASISELQEVVVIGYGERERKDITGAISSMDSKQISKSTSVAPEMAMQGRMAGVFVSTPGGNPNARPTVQIRGIGTFNDASPLYVVDGVPLFEFGQGTTQGVVGDIRGNVNILSLINPGDIESISVLKDASASAIYGSRAANGVVLITTKKGKKGAPRVEFNMSTGVQEIPGKYKVLNTQQLTGLYTEMFDADTEYRRQYAPSADPGAAYTWDYVKRAIRGSDYYFLSIFNPSSVDPYFKYLGNSPTYDWQSELRNKSAAVKDYSVRVSGGSETATYYLGAGYSRTESPLKGNNLDRYSLSANVQSKISKYVETGVLYRLSYVEALDNTSGDLASAATVSPWQPIYDPTDPDGFARTTDVSFVPNPNFDLNLANPGPADSLVDGSDQFRPWGNESSSNIFAQMALSETKYSLLKNFGNAYIQVQPIEGLKIKGGVSVDYTYNRRNSWDYSTKSVRFSETPGNPYNNQDGTAVGTYSERHARNINIIGDVTVTYAKKIKDHNIEFLFNASTQRLKYELVGGSSPQQYADPSFRRLGGLPRFNDSQSNFDNKVIQGYVGRLSYNFKSRYYLDASLRRDGSSEFAPDYRWGTFPAVSAAWRISGENFFSSAVQSFDDLKLRVGYGELGNSFSTGGGFSPFAYLSTVSTSPSYSLGSGSGNSSGTQYVGAYLPVFPNAGLSWETAKTFNIGLDGALLNNRLTFTIEYYNKRTEGIIQGVNLPANTGIDAQVQYNIATTTNTGIELQLGYVHNIGDLQLSFNGNFTTVKNRVTSLFNGVDIPDAGLEVGKPIGFIYGYKVGGVFQTQDEIDTYRDSFQDQANATQRPGDMWFQDVHGNPTEAGQLYSPDPDGLVNENDRTYLGKTTPGFFYGFNIGATYKGFDLSIFFQGIGDVQKYNWVRAGGESMNGTGLNQWTTTDNRWTPENPSTTMPRAIYGDPNDNNRVSDRFVEDASFLRLKNVQLGYTIPKTWIEKTKVVNTFRIFVSGTNMFTATNWSGIDPENDNVPPTRLYSLGLNATF